MVEGLMREFVPRELVAGLDFSGMQRVNPKFHSNRRWARRREGDVIWRLPTHEGSDICLYLLIEFQSENDTWMAVRTQVYQGLLWQQVIDEQKLEAGSRLPPLLLLVLYNGERRWKAATTTRELVAISPDSAPWPWQPQVRYYLVDIGALAQNELARRSSLVALLFRLEQRHSPERVTALVEEVICWFQQHAGYDRLQGLFTELIREAFAGRGVNTSGVDLLEMKNMISIDYDGWQERWLAKGRAEGLAEGEAKGKTEGKAEALISLLVGRFGVVAPSWRKRIRRAELATLERWFKRAIDAPDLPSVFNPPP